MVREGEFPKHISNSYTSMSCSVTGWAPNKSYIIHTRDNNMVYYSSRSTKQTMLRYETEFDGIVSFNDGSCSYIDACDGVKRGDSEFAGGVETPAVPPSTLYPRNDSHFVVFPANA